MASIMNDSWEEIQARNAMERLDESIRGSIKEARYQHRIDKAYKNANKHTEWDEGEHYTDENGFEAWDSIGKAKKDHEKQYYKAEAKINAAVKRYEEARKSDPEFRKAADRRDHPVDEGAVGTAAKAGALIGVGAGVYGGIKQHRLDKIAREEKALRWTNIKNRVLSDHNRSANQKRRIRDAKREAEIAKYKKLKRDYDAGRNPDAGPSLKERILGRDDAVDEGVVAPALAGYAAYKVAKGIVKPVVKKIADDQELAEYEHERAFGESPKDSVRRVLPKRKPKNEAAEIVDESITGNIKTYLQGRKIAKKVAKINASKLDHSSTICSQLNKKLASDIATVRKNLADHLKNSEAPEAKGFHLSSKSKAEESRNFVVTPTEYGFGIEFVDWDIWEVYPDDARTRANNDDCAGFWKVYNELGAIIRNHFGGSGRVLGDHVVISDTGDWDGGSIELFISNADALRIVNGDENGGSYPRNESVTGTLSKVW